MKQPKISVLMSVYNGEEYLSEAIESILNQSFSDFEFIITNDKSTDSSRDIIARYANKDDRIIFIDNEENIGLTRSLNKMLKVARGEFVARMDSDDISETKRFEIQLKEMSVRPVDVVFSGTTYIDKSGKIICESYRPDNLDVILKNLEIHNYIPHPTVMINKETLLENGGYDESYKTGQDKTLWVRLRDTDCKFSYVRLSLLRYRLNPRSVRAGIYSDYWNMVVNYCLWNKSRWSSIRYIHYLTARQLMVWGIKFFVPHFIFLRKLK